MARKTAPASASQESIWDIDTSNLLEECRQQPARHRQAGFDLAEAKADLARAEAKKKVVEAEVDRDVRRNPEHHGLKAPPTETSIKHAVVMSKRYQDAVEDVITAQHRLDILEANLWASTQRKEMLNNAVSLALSGLNADVKPRHESLVNEPLEQKLRQDTYREMNKHVNNKEPKKGGKR